MSLLQHICATGAIHVIGVGSSPAIFCSAHLRQVALQEFPIIISLLDPAPKVLFLFQSQTYVCSLYVPPVRLSPLPDLQLSTPSSSTAAVKQLHCLGPFVRSAPIGVAGVITPVDNRVTRGVHEGLDSVVLGVGHAALLYQRTGSLHVARVDLILATNDARVGKAVLLFPSPGCVGYTLKPCCACVVELKGCGIESVGDCGREDYGASAQYLHQEYNVGRCNHLG